MSIIVDCNVAHTINPRDADGGPIFERLQSAEITLCIGGRLTTELNSTKLAGLFPALRAAGRLFSAKTDQVNELESVLSEKIESDDPHVLAVALLSGCRLLYSNDRALHRDFINEEIIPTPKGKIYQYSRHHLHLLRSACGR